MFYVVWATAAEPPHTHTLDLLFGKVLEMCWPQNKDQTVYTLWLLYFILVSRKSRKWILVGIQGPSENEDRNTSFTLSEKYILDNSRLFEQLDANLIYGRPRSSLYVSQIVLTPSAWNIVSNIDSSLEKWENPTMNKSLQWLNLHHAGGRHGFNIVIRDFVDTEFTRTGFARAF